MNDELRELDYRERGGRRIRFRKKALGLSRGSLAEKLDISPQFLADIEYGNKGMSIATLYRLRQILGLTADYGLAGGLSSGEPGGETARVREAIIITFQGCNADQLSGVKKVVWILVDKERRKE